VKPRLVARRASKEARKQASNKTQVQKLGRWLVFATEIARTIKSRSVHVATLNIYYTEDAAQTLQRVFSLNRTERPLRRNRNRGRAAGNYRNRGGNNIELAIKVPEKEFRFRNLKINTNNRDMIIAEEFAN